MVGRGGSPCDAAPLLRMGDSASGGCGSCRGGFRPLCDSGRALHLSEAAGRRENVVARQPAGPYRYPHGDCSAVDDRVMGQLRGR